MQVDSINFEHLIYVLMKMDERLCRNKALISKYFKSYFNYNAK